MAWLDQRGKSFRVVFQIGGQTIKRSLGTTDRREATGRVAAVERRITMVERGELSIPESVDLPTFLLGDEPAKPQVAVPTARTLGDTVSAYLASIPAGSLEATPWALYRFMCGGSSVRIPH